MKRKTLLSLAAALFLAASLVSAQPPMAWDQIYGGSDSDRCYSVHQTADGNIYLKGVTWSYGAGDSDLFLVKTDESGNELWWQTYGGAGTEFPAHQIYQNQDSSIIVGGYTQSFGVVPNDFYLVKTDLDGTELWAYTYGSDESETCYGVSQTNDGGYIMSGCTSTPNAYYDVYLVKVNSMGIEEWNMTHGYPDKEVCYGVRQTSDSGYITAGFTRSLGTYDDGYLLKTDSLGNVEWDQHYAGHSWDYFFTVLETLDGGYIAAGYSDAYPGGPAQMWAVKTDAVGNQLWNKYYGESGEDRCYSLQLSPDGGYFLGGGTDPTVSGEFYDMWLVKINSQGVLLWEETYGDNDAEMCNALLPTENGGFLMGGYNVPYGGGDMDMYLVRLEDQGEPSFTLTLTPYDPPIQIPAGGGTFQYDLEIVNTGTGWCLMDFWMAVTTPGGYTFNIFEREGLFSYAGNVIARSGLVQYVPGSILPGTYTYSAYVKDSETWEVYAEDSFDFEKLPGSDALNHNQDWALFGWNDEIVSVDSAPAEMLTYPVFPNPFNPTTNISFELRVASSVNLVVYDITGKTVAELANGWMNPGRHEVTFDASGLASGVYVYQLQADDFRANGKMVLMK